MLPNEASKNAGKRKRSTLHHCRAFRPSCPTGFFFDGFSLVLKRIGPPGASREGAWQGAPPEHVLRVFFRWFSTGCWEGFGSWGCEKTCGLRAHMQLSATWVWKFSFCLSRFWHEWTIKSALCEPESSCHFRDFRFVLSIRLAAGSPVQCKTWAANLHIWGSGLGCPALRSFKILNS